MWLDVLELDAFSRGDARNRSDLIEHEIFGFLRGDVEFAPAKTDKIGKSRMRANGHAMVPGQSDGRAQD